MPDTKTQNPFLPFCVVTESPANSLAGLVSALYVFPCPKVPMSRRLSGFEMSRGSAVPEPLTTSSGVGAR